MKTVSKPNAALARRIAANVRAIELADYAPANDGRFVHDHIVAANASLFTESFFSEGLTNYAAGWRDNTLDMELPFFCPPVEVPRRFEYAQATNAEEFFSDVNEDARAIGGDFAEPRYTESKVDAKTLNRGLQICVDLDEISDKANWREQKAAKLLRRLQRNKLRRAIALLSAAATNTAKTWDTTAGKDPDNDVLTELVTAATASGIKPNRVGYGDTAWSKRVLSHRAQDLAGQGVSASMNEDELAGLLGVEQVLRSKSRYAPASGTKAESLANLVLMFYALDNADTEDGSNIKDFWSPCENGERFRVYEQQLSPKRYLIMVEHYELLKITSTLGIRKFTVS